MNKFASHILLLIYLSFCMGVFAFGITHFSFFFAPDLLMCLRLSIDILMIQCTLNTECNKTINIFLIVLVNINLILLFLLFNSLIYLTISNFIMFYFVFFLLLFFACLLNDAFTIKYRNIFYLQAVVTTICFFGNLLFLYLEALFFLINICLALGLCFYLYLKDKGNFMNQKMLKIMISSIFLSIFPYLIFTFLPVFIFPDIGMLSCGDWPLLFILILPITFTYYLSQQNHQLKKVDFQNPFIRVFGIGLFYICLDIFVIFIFHPSITELYILDSSFLIILVIYDMGLLIYSNYRQRKLGKLLNDFELEALSIQNQMLSNSQIDLIGNLISNFIQDTYIINGLLLVWNQSSDPLVLWKNGKFNEISFSNVKKYISHDNSIVTFTLKDCSCAVIPLYHIKKKVGSLILCRPINYLFSNNELLGLQNLAEIISEILMTSILIIENQSNKNWTQYTPYERLTYLKSIDLADRDKKNLSTYLHDNILQDVLSVKNLTSMLDGNKEIIELIDTTLEKLSFSLRERMFGLYPSFLSENELIVSVENLIEKLNEQFRDKIVIEFNFPKNWHPSVKEKHLLYRIIKELVTNVYKHSKASIIILIIEKTANNIRLIIRDNGIGISNNKLSYFELAQNHFGLVSLKQEITFLEGTFKIITGPSKGFCAEITLPRIEGNT